MRRRGRGGRGRRARSDEPAVARCSSEGHTPSSRRRRAAARARRRRRRCADLVANRAHCKPRSHLRPPYPRRTWQKLAVGVVDRLDAASRSSMRSLSPSQCGLRSTERSMAQREPSASAVPTTARESPAHAVWQVSCDVAGSTASRQLTAVATLCEQSRVPVHVGSCSRKAATSAERSSCSRRRARSAVQLRTAPSLAARPGDHAARAVKDGEECLRCRHAALRRGTNPGWSFAGHRVSCRYPSMMRTPRGLPRPLGVHEPDWMHLDAGRSASAARWRPQAFRGRLQKRRPLVRTDLALLCSADAERREPCRHGTFRNTNQFDPAPCP